MWGFGLMVFLEGLLLLPDSLLRGQLLKHTWCSSLNDRSFALGAGQLIVFKSG